jgi:hypothetical protein
LIASSTLSSTVSFGNRLVIWKVRAIPSAVRRWLGQPVMSLPNSRTCPEVAGRTPVTTLNSVVLPAPFGPMMALRSPGKTLRFTSWTAWSPPKLLEALQLEDGIVIHGVRPHPSSFPFSKWRRALSSPGG